MPLLRHLAAGFRSLFRKSRAEQELADELEHYLESAAAEKMKSGLSRKEALRAARLEMRGSAEGVKEAVRASGWEHAVETVWQDLRYAARQLRRSPGFAAVAILTLALGIGANTAIFTLLYTVMLRPLPVRDPGSLVLLQWHARRMFQGDSDYSGFGYCQDAPDMFLSKNRNKSAWGCSFSFPFFQSVRSQAAAFNGVAAFGGSGNIRLTGNGALDLVNAQMVSGDFFQVLGIHPALGRLIQPADDRPDAPAAVVLSYGYWRSEFSGAPSAIGRSIQLNGVPAAIVGVAPPQFTSAVPGDREKMWLACAMFPRVNGNENWGHLADISNMWLTVLGHLKPGISRSQAQAEVSLMYRNQVVSGSKPLWRAADDPAIALLPAQKGLTGGRQAYESLLYLLFCGVSIILLIACANVAGLLLAKSATRRKETAVRLALGAGRARVIRQLLTESVVLSLSGGFVGVLIAYGGVHALAALLAGGSADDFRFSLAPDARILAFTAGISILTGLIAGLAPAFRGTRLDLTPALKEGEREGTMAGATRWFKSGSSLVVAQVALATVVLAGAGLFVRTLQNLKSIDLGFDPRNTLVVEVEPELLAYKPAQIQSLYTSLEARFASLPGALSVTYSNAMLLGGSRWGGHFAIEGLPNTDPGVSMQMLAVGANFFRTMRIPILEGRALGPADVTVSADQLSQLSSSASLPVIVNRAFVREYFPHRSPLGVRLFKGGWSSAEHMDEAKVAQRGWEIVGVCADAKYDTLRDTILPTVYLPGQSGTAAFEIRTAADPTPLIPVARSIVKSMDRDLPVTVRTEAHIIDNELSRQRLTARLSVVFALLALLLACIGLYGMLSYETARRTREIGIRMALGAAPANVLRHVVRQGITVALIGAALGAAASFAVTGYLRTLLFGVQPNDPATLIGVAVVLLLTALVACYIPARRAMRVDPVTALRSE